MAETLLAWCQTCRTVQCFSTPEALAYWESHHVHEVAA